MPLYSSCRTSSALAQQQSDSMCLGQSSPFIGHHFQDPVPLCHCMECKLGICPEASRRILQQQNQHASGQMHTLPSMLTRSLRVLVAPPERHHWGPASNCSHEWSPQQLIPHLKPATVSLYSSRRSLWLMQAHHQEWNLRICWQEHLLNQLCSVVVSFIT